MLKHIPQSWKDDMRTNFNHDLNFYINPRGRVLPALTSAGVSYIKNDATTNMRGTYRMQTGASTDLTYLYTLPQRFIIEGWFKPEFAYDVTSFHRIWDSYDSSGNNGAVLAYNPTNDYLYFYTSIDSNAIVTTAFLNNSELQKWVYVRCYFDNVSKLKGFYCTVNGVIYADSQNIPGAGDFLPLNVFRFFSPMPGACESSFWIIHELDETLATGEYKTYQADRQIIFDFNGTTLGRERIRIPRFGETSDNRGVRSFSLSKSVENPMTGSAGANTASMSLLNINGQFSDDQYGAFDPFNGYYNGTQKYLQNRVSVEIESNSPANTIRDGLQAHWSFDNSTIPVTDNSGNGYNLADNGTTIDTSGKSGNARASDGSQYLTAGDVLDITTAFTWVWWFKIASATGSIQSITSKDGGAGNRGPWLYVAATTGRPAFIISGDGTAQSVATEPTINYCDGLWHLAIGEFIPSTSVSLYIDNNLSAQNTTSIPAAQFNSSASLDVMRRPGGTLYLTGSVDEGRIYNRILTDAEKTWLYNNPSDWGAISKIEPIFIGRTTPGAFRRNSPSKFYGDVSIDIEDGISELGETKLRRAYAFDSYDLCDPVAESDSLVHSIARLVTKKEIRNYALNSSIENATIANSWTNSGMATFERSNTYAQFGTYSMKCIADAAGDEVNQYILFEDTDKIDVGDVFNFSAYIRKDTASSVTLRIYEYDSVGVIVGSTSITGDSTGVFTRENIPYTITSANCTRLRIDFYANQACTFYVDGVMLTRGIDPIDYFLLNATDGASGAGSADLAATTTYDSVAFDCDAVDVEHPYALVEQGQTTWDALKKIGDASIASYIGMSPDGVMQFKVRYNGDDMPNMGDVEDFGGVATSLEAQGANSIKVHGVIINGTSTSGATATKQIWSGEASGIFQTDAGNKILHPIADAAYMSVSGATEIELKYSEDL